MLKCVTQLPCRVPSSWLRPRTEKLLSLSDATCFWWLKDRHVEEEQVENDSNFAQLTEPSRLRGKMCSSKSLCHLFVVLNILTATILVQGHNNSTFYYTRFGGRMEEELQLERMLRDVLGGLNTSSSYVPHSRQRRASRFIHYDFSDNAVNVRYCSSSGHHHPHKQHVHRLTDRTELSDTVPDRKKAATTTTTTEQEETLQTNSGTLLAETFYSPFTVSLSLNFSWEWSSACTSCRSR